MGAKKTSIVTLDIDGLKVHVDTDKCKTWRVFKIMANVTEDITPQTLQAMVDYVEAVSDVDEAAIVEHCGGDDATLEDVVKVLAQIINESHPKNS